MTVSVPTSVLTSSPSECACATTVVRSAPLVKPLYSKAPQLAAHAASVVSAAKAIHEGSRYVISQISLYNLFADLRIVDDLCLAVERLLLAGSTLSHQMPAS